MKFKISHEAKSDLEAIWLYTFENWSLAQADKYINLIFDEIEFLAQNPYSGRNYDEIRTGYHRSQVNSHFIFYKINSRSDEIEVIRILHQKMQIDAHLNK